MSKTRTPGPWRVVERAGAGINIEWGKEDREPRPICHMRWTDGLSPKTEQAVAEDAAYIVRAVNAYDELVKAVRGLLNEIQACVLEGTLPQDAVDSNAGVIAARAALAKAGK